VILEKAIALSSPFLGESEVQKRNSDAPSLTKITVEVDSI